MKLSEVCQKRSKINHGGKILNSRSGVGQACNLSISDAAIYLGSVIDGAGSTFKDVKVRIWSSRGNQSALNCVFIANVKP